MPKNLTLRRELPKEVWGGYQGQGRTLFKEVSVEKRKEPVIEKTKPINSKNWKKNLFNAFVKSVENNWKPGRAHVIGHSSGYDSRLFSVALRELFKKNGSKWVGDVIFVENLGETESFKAIMKYFGWKNYIAYRDGIKPNFYYEPYVGFKDLYKKFNGVVGYPLNTWHDSFQDLTEKGQIPKDNITYVTLYFSKSFNIKFCF